MVLSVMLVVREWVEKKELMIVDEWVVVEAVNRGGLQRIESEGFRMGERIDRKEEKPVAAADVMAASGFVRKPTACNCPAPEDALLQPFTATHSSSASTPSIIKSPAAAPCRLPRVSLSPTQSCFADAVASHRSRFMFETDESRVRDNIQSTESNEVSDMSPMIMKAQFGSKRNRSSRTSSKPPQSRKGIERVFIVVVDNASANKVAISYLTNKLKTWRDDALVLNDDSMHPFRGSVVLDRPTRWNFAYTMLTTALKFRSTFNRMTNEDKLYDAYFREEECGKKMVGPLGS
ncbi:hypothetical protein WN943_001644 [Citrus x changshan-huyou]